MFPSSIRPRSRRNRNGVGSYAAEQRQSQQHHDLRRREQSGVVDEAIAALDLGAEGAAWSDRTRRIRDAVEAALGTSSCLGPRSMSDGRTGRSANWSQAIPSIRTSWSCRRVRPCAMRSISIRSRPIRPSRCKAPRVRRRPGAAEAAVAGVVWVAAAGLAVAACAAMSLAKIRTISRRRTRSDRLKLPDCSSV